VARQKPDHNQDVLRNDTLRYAELFSKRDLDNLAELFCSDAVLSDPAEKTIAGKTAILAFMQRVFALENHFVCDVRNVWVDGATTILEFRLTIGSAALEGVDVIEWREGRIAAIRAYVNAN
jgi:ketosteroid isomerase-like protein